MDERGVSRQLAAFAIESTPTFGAVRAAHELTVAAILDGIVGSRSPEVSAVVASLTSVDTTATVRLLGRSERLSPFDGALVNGMAIAAGAREDRPLPDASAAVVPAVLAAAELTAADGRAVCDAVACGAEVLLRLRAALPAVHTDRGWDPAGTLGRFGAAVAAARLLEVDLGQTLVALAIGATESAGLRVALGTGAGLLQRGKAASDGLEAVILARHGMTGPEAPLEGRRGFAAIMAPGLDQERLLNGLGSLWQCEHDAAMVSGEAPGDPFRGTPARQPQQLLDLCQLLPDLTDVSALLDATNPDHEDRRHA